MTRKPTRRIEFTVPDELGDRYDEWRGLVPMATWIKAVLGAYGSSRTQSWDGEQPPTRVVAQNHRKAERAEFIGRSSSDAKRAVRPIPKAEKR